ncbi:hypothetical protein IW262DRAFT_524866 [Armillaria fumosa]|nr:hypothetical protein IW262DRAFT_524866 [Armillaria fumosa]
MPTENCPTCGLPSHLDLKDDVKKAQILGILREEQPLLESDRDWIHQNIATLDDHLLSLHQSLSRLESLAALIKTQIDTASTTKQRLESISAPIRRLPRDILLEIFSLSSSLTPDAKYYPWNMSHVCHWWRDIVHSSLKLWSVVVLSPPYNPKNIETQLQRSGNVPDRVMGLCHRWSKLELHAYAPLRHAEKLPTFLPQLRTLKALGTWSRIMVPALDAPLLKTVRSDNFPLQSAPHHITHLALSGLSIKELPLLSSFPDLVELRFTANYFDQVATHALTITHPTIRCLSVSGTTMLPFLTLPALEHLHYVDTIRSNSVVSAFLSRSRCTLKTLVANMRYGDNGFLDLLESQPSLCRLLVDPIGDFNHALIRKLSSPEFLPNLEHLSFRYINVEAVKMIQARWYAPMSMQAMINEGLEVKVAEGLHVRELWLDPLMTETEGILV